MRLIHTLYEPAGDGPHPTLIAMHGFGASALDLLGLAPYIADGRFMVICPQGPIEVPIGADARLRVVSDSGWARRRIATQSTRPTKRPTEFSEHRAREVIRSIEKVGRPGI